MEWLIELKTQARVYWLGAGFLLAAAGLGIMYFGAASTRRRRGRRMRRIGLVLFAVGIVVLLLAAFQFLFNIGDGRP